MSDLPNHRFLKPPIVLWRGYDSARNLYMLQSTDGISFTTRMRLADSSYFAPNLTKVGSQIILSWSSNDKNSKDLLLERSGFNNPVSSMRFGVQSDYNFPFVQFLGKTYIGWTQSFDNNIRIADLSSFLTFK
jgi:hypothetical protein